MTFGAVGFHPVFMRGNLLKAMPVLRKVGRETEKENSHPDGNI